MRKKRLIYYYALFAQLVFCLLITGCKPKMIHTLQADAISEPRFKSVIFGRVQVTSKKGLLRYVFGDGDDANICINIIGKSDRVNFDRIITKLDPWLTSYSYDIDKPFYVEAEPGVYDVRSVSFNSIHTKYLVGIADFGSLENSKSVFNIPEGKLVYIGTIEVNVTDYQKVVREYSAPGTDPLVGKITNQMQIKNELENELEVFKTKHPLLYEQYKGHILSIFRSKP